MDKILSILILGLLLISMPSVSAADPDIDVMRAVPSDPYIYTNFEIYVRADDNDGIDKIKFYNDGNLADTEYCDSDEECSVYFDVYESTSGNHAYKVKVYDEEGDVETKTISVYVNKYYTGAIPPYQYNYCGNGVCTSGETCSTCPADCGACTYCGNGICSAGESCATCPQDCGACNYCGNGACNSGESCSSCPQDCGSCPIKTPTTIPKVIYTCKQRGGECCEYGGIGVVDGAADCPSKCYSICNAKPGSEDTSSDNEGSDNTPSGAAVVADSSLVVLVALLLVFFALLYVAMKR